AQGKAHAGDGLHRQATAGHGLCRRARPHFRQTTWQMDRAWASVREHPAGKEVTCGLADDPTQGINAAAAWRDQISADEKPWTWTVALWREETNTDSEKLPSGDSDGNIAAAGILQQHCGIY